MVNNRQWLEQLGDSRQFTNELRAVTDRSTDRDLAGRVAGVLSLTAMYAKLGTGFVAYPEGPDISNFMQEATLEKHVKKKIDTVVKAPEHEIVWLKEDSAKFNQIPWLQALGVARSKFPLMHEIKLGEIIIRQSMLDHINSVESAISPSPRIT